MAYLYRRSSLFSLLLLTVLALLLGYGYYMYSELSQKLISTEWRVKRAHSHEEVLKDQLKVVLGHISKLQLSLKKETDDHKTAKTNIQTLTANFQANLTRSRHEALNRFNALDTEYKMLKAQYDELKDQLDVMRQQYGRLSGDHKKMSEESKLRYETLRQEKDEESHAMQGRIQELYNASTYCEHKAGRSEELVARLQLDLRRLEEKVLDFENRNKSYEEQLTNTKALLEKSLQVNSICQNNLNATKRQLYHANDEMSKLRSALTARPDRMTSNASVSVVTNAKESKHLPLARGASAENILGSVDDGRSHGEPVSHYTDVAASDLVGFPGDKNSRYASIMRSIVKDREGANFGSDTKSKDTGYATQHSDVASRPVEQPIGISQALTTRAKPLVTNEKEVISKQFNGHGQAERGKHSSETKEFRVSHGDNRGIRVNPVAKPIAGQRQAGVLPSKTETKDVSVRDAQDHLEQLAPPLKNTDDTAEKPAAAAPQQIKAPKVLEKSPLVVNVNSSGNVSVRSAEKSSAHAHLYEDRDASHDGHAGQIQPPVKSKTAEAGRNLAANRPHNQMPMPKAPVMHSPDSEVRPLHGAAEEPAPADNAAGKEPTVIQNAVQHSRSDKTVIAEHSERITDHVRLLSNAELVEQKPNVLPNVRPRNHMPFKSPILRASDDDVRNIASTEKSLHPPARGHKHAGNHAKLDEDVLEHTAAAAAADSEMEGHESRTLMRGTAPSNGVRGRGLEQLPKEEELDNDDDLKLDHGGAEDSDEGDAQNKMAGTDDDDAQPKQVRNDDREAEVEDEKGDQNLDQKR